MTTRTEFDEWLAVQRNRAQPALFPDLVPTAPAHDCARDGHLYEKTESDEPLTWTCAECGEVRHRC